MTLDRRRAAILAAMGVDAWHLRAPSVPGALAARVHSEVAGGIPVAQRPWETPAVSRPSASRRMQPAPLAGAEPASLAAHAGSVPQLDTSPIESSTAAPHFEPVGLRLWRTARALFVVSPADVAPVRFLADLQRALDGDPAFGLRDLPPFAWPPQDHPELGNVASLRSAWGALLRRIHREQSISLLITFGPEVTMHLVAVASLMEKGGAIEPAPHVLAAPRLDVLLGSSAARRALWAGLRGR